MNVPDRDYSIYYTFDQALRYVCYSLSKIEKKLGQIDRRDLSIGHRVLLLTRYAFT